MVQGTIHITDLTQGYLRAEGAQDVESAYDGHDEGQELTTDHVAVSICQDVTQ